MKKLLMYAFLTLAVGVPTVALAAEAAEAGCPCCPHCHAGCPCCK
jgi:hypothetical protein